MKYHIRLVYKDSEARRVSEFDAVTWDYIYNVLQLVKSEYDLVFMTISDNEAETRIHGAKNLVTFYDAETAIEMTRGLSRKADELSAVIRSYLKDYIKSHEVRR